MQCLSRLVLVDFVLSLQQDPYMPDPGQGPARVPSEAGEKVLSITAQVKGQ
ncbi:MAG: hypothetical protein HYU64_09795 [Armatimonadetes bacterium]|nr:hypothetical protein [Armatimonadota bacterium]